MAVALNSLAFHPDGHHVVSGGYDRTVQVCETPHIVEPMEQLFSIR
jgi:hypothetical protein